MQFKCRARFYPAHYINLGRLDVFCLSDHPKDVDLLLILVWCVDGVITIAFVLQW